MSSLDRLNSLEELRPDVEVIEHKALMCALDEILKELKKMNTHFEEWDGEYLDDDN